MKNQLLDKFVPVKTTNRTFIIVAITIALLFVSATVAAQTPYEEPKPGLEHQKLAGLIGSWTTAGEVIENPFGPAEKWSGKYTWAWTPGKFGIVRHFDGKGSVTGENRGIEIIAYDIPAKTYAWYGVDNQGWTGILKSSISGDVLIATWEQQAKGRTYKLRGTLKGIGSDRVTWVSEYSEDGKSWIAYFHATDNRVITAQATDNVEQTLAKMEQDWVDATLKKDVAFVDSLLADDYVGIGPDGRAVPKPQAIEEFRSGTFSAQSMSISGIKVKVFGDTAVVTYGQTEKSQYQGKDTSGRTKYTDIFVKRNGKWQLVANHASRDEEPKN